jgi:MFS-type transporter involved in bile tolerance (Atg22 family)
MNREDIFETLLFILESALIYFACYFFANKMCYSVKYKGEKRAYLKILIANVVCFLFFLIYGLLDNYFGIKVKFLAPIWFLLFPISSLLIVIFSILFFFTKHKDSKHNEANK